MTKKILLIFCYFILPLVTISQISLGLNGTVEKKISANLPEGTNVILKSIDQDKVWSSFRGCVLINGEIEYVSLNLLNRISFDPSDLKEFWQSQALSHNVYQKIFEKGIIEGYNYELRRELEEEALEYLSYLKSHNLIFEDSYLESYLYALAYKIYPTQIEDGRPGILSIKILKNNVPNAFIFSNGMIFLTTGLLSTINSEEELIGIMAHEISHFVLDHSVSNIEDAKERKKKAEFWAAFATGLAAVADVYTAANNDYYAPGIITASTGLLAFSIAAKVNERMGLEYSKEQEVKADECAVALMKFIDVDPTALSSALLKIKAYNILNGNYLAISENGTHPAIADRVSTMGKPSLKFKNSNYDKIISLVTSFNAIVEMNSQHFQSSMDLVNRNINAGVATEADYILLAMLTTFMHDNAKKNSEALSYINKAKNLNVSPTITIHKQEAIILIRLDEYAEAKSALNKYLTSLESEHSKIGQIKSASDWSYATNYLLNEKEWTLKMINKVDKM